MRTVPKVQTNKVLQEDPNPQYFIAVWLLMKASNGTDVVLLVRARHKKYHRKEFLEPLKTRRLFDRKTGQYWETNLGAVHRIITQSVGNKFALSFPTLQKIKSLGEGGIDRFLMEDGTMISETEMQRKIDQGKLVGVREHFSGELTFDESEMLRQSIRTKRAIKHSFICKQDLPSIASVDEEIPYNSNVQAMFNFDKEIITSLLP